MTPRAVASSGDFYRAACATATAISIRPSTIREMYNCFRSNIDTPLATAWSKSNTDVAILLCICIYRTYRRSKKELPVCLTQEL